MVGPDDGRVDHVHLAGPCPAVIQRIQHQFPQTGQRPAAKLTIDTRPFAKLFRQIAPLGPGSGDPEDAIENPSMIRSRSATATAYCDNEIQEERPFSVIHQQPCQDRLRRENDLESRFRRFGNPVCQQVLVSGPPWAQIRHLQCGQTQRSRPNLTCTSGRCGPSGRNGNGRRAPGCSRGRARW